MGSSETRRRPSGGLGHWVAAMGYVIGAFVLLKAPKGFAWRPARRTREDVSKRSREKARRGEPPAGPASLPAAARPESSKPAAGHESAPASEAGSVPEPMPRGDLTPSALRRHDGSNRALPILLAAKGVVYDVTRASVHIHTAVPTMRAFTGHSTAHSRAAKMSLDPADVSLHGTSPT